MDRDFDPEQLSPEYSSYVTELSRTYGMSQIMPEVIRRKYDNKVLREMVESLYVETGAGEIYFSSVDDIFSTYDVNRIANIIFNDWVSTTLEGGDEGINIVTPFTLEYAKRDSWFEKVLPPFRRTLPIAVHAFNTHYFHKVVEEFTLGLLLGLQNNNDIYIVLVDERNDDISPIQVNDIAPNFTTEAATRYYATVRRKKYYFESVEFIQGIITGCKWLNINPHTIITNIMDGDNRVIF